MSRLLAIGSNSKLSGGFGTVESTTGEFTNFYLNNGTSFGSGGAGDEDLNMNEYDVYNSTWLNSTNVDSTTAYFDNLYISNGTEFVDGGSGSSGNTSLADYIIDTDGTNIWMINTTSGDTDWTTTDADNIFNACFGNLSSGGVVYVKDGTYLCDANLTPNSYTTIQGESWASIIKVDDGANVDLFVLSGKANVVFRDFKIDGNKANQVGEDNWECFVFSNSCTDCRIENLWIYNSFSDSVLMNDCSDFVITENLIEGSGDCAIYLNDGCENNTVSYNRIKDNDDDEMLRLRYAVSGNKILFNTFSGGVSAGISLYGYNDGHYCMNNLVQGNTITDCVYGIDAGEDNPTGLFENIITENHCFNNTEGIRIGGERNKVSNNILKYNGRNIRVWYCGNSTITGNTCSFTTAYSNIRLEYADFCLVANNLCTNAYTNYDGITIRDDSDNCTITNNVCLFNDNNGIQIVHANCNSTVLIGNDVRNNGSGTGISDAGTNTMNHAYVDDSGYHA